ncbi:MAG: two-component system regulatory protein YycI [Sedimentibacter sp.]|uniref:two-component system regulatory protein YycI n=1 Tax=Sedimentibacter sp. TaxID=1960295 RepID=UPI0029820B5D|nr:two-component system regulatory protein YycI [Sedimentibacter sp.]MDW5300061.1 two-component system regulatory protein YycI [Sedimentibacter sp.]
MDWNKSNTILIVAFVILNIFLLVSFYNNSFSEEYNVMSDEQFVMSVEELLKQKNITINCDIPKDTYILPVLDTNYEMIKVNNEIVNQYLGAGVEAVKDVFVYNNEKGEMLEIIDGKKLRFTIRDKVQGKIEDEENIIKEINNFIKDKNIDAYSYNESFKYISDDGCMYMYTQKFNDYSIDNSYMNFFADAKGIYKFEMQQITSMTEIMGKVRAVPAIEALTRLLTYDEIKDKEITNIEITYYSREDENWYKITRINSDPTWKVEFSDGTQKHLSSLD